MLRRQISFVFIITAVLGFMAAAAAAQTLKAEAVDSVPDAGWQVKAVFPDWRGYVDDTLAMNSMASFDGWQGQGYLYVTLKSGVRSLRLFVNGREADLSGLKGGMSARIDYSSAARNGKNTVQVTEILPDNLEEAVTVCVPYPTVIQGTPEEAGISPDTLSLIDDLIASDVQYGFPGAQLAVIRHGRLIYNKAWGKVNAYLPDGTPNRTGAPITVRTLFDLASVTKMFSANYALQKLLTEERFSSYLYSSGIPDPDLLIRPGGEQRISNFLLWQCAYSEFYFTDVLWPDFSTDELDKAIEVYRRRDRRYGGVK